VLTFLTKNNIRTQKRIYRIIPELINSTKIVSGKIFSKYALDTEMKGLKRERKTNKKEKVIA